MHLRHLVGLGTLLLALGAITTGPAAGSAGPVAEDAGYGRMILLLDSSGSMAEPAGGGQTKIAAARSALRTVVKDLPLEAEVGLRVFGAEVFSRKDAGACTDSQLVVEPGTDNRDELADAIGGYEPYGETPIPHALQEAANDLGNEGARSIVLVSDGESTCDPDPCKVAAQLQGNGIDLQVDVVGLSVSGDARRQLQCIAENGNGTYYDADDAADIVSRLTRVAERAIRPFVLTGQPIVGGPETAPTPVTVGEYVDTLGPNRATKSYEFERTTAGTTLRAVAITQGERQFIEGLTIEIFGPDGRCDYGLTTRALDTREVIGVQATAEADNGAMFADTCDQPGNYRITVTRGQGTEDTIPFGLRVSEEPPIDELGFTDPAAGEVEVAAPQADGPAEAVEGGTSFAHATPIGPGTWKSTVVPGESLLFAVPLEFGQAARISVDFPHATGRLADVFGRFPPLAHLSVYDPMGAQVGHPSDATFLDNADGVRLLTATPAVSRDPIDLGGYKSNGGGDFSTAGAYYVGLSIQKEEYTVEVPFTLKVEIVGGPAQGPTYAGGVAWTVAEGSTDGGATSPDGSPSATPGEAEVPAADPDETGGTATMVAVAVGAGALGVAALTGVVLWRRRRS